jgi:hypothetical protein
MNTRKWVELKNAPSSSSWNFRGEKNGFRLYTSRNLKQFAQNIETKKWYQLKTLEG